MEYGSVIANFNLQKREWTAYNKNFSWSWSVKQTVLSRLEKLYSSIAMHLLYCLTKFRRLILSKNVIACSIAEFELLFDCKIETIPRNIVLIGWLRESNKWICAPGEVVESTLFKTRIEATLEFLEKSFIPKFKDELFWALCCFYDGWRERNIYSGDYRWVNPVDISNDQEWKGAPGEIPIMSKVQPYVFCYGAHRGDPSAILLPEAHYLSQNFYKNLFATVNESRVSWRDKLSKAIYCAGDHGEIANYFPPIVDGRLHQRRYLKSILENKESLPVYLCLGKRVSIREQLRYKYILDVDGFVRTWDAWAWKMFSGSTVLSVDSPWETFFTKLYTPWIHYVPIANDFSDLSEKLDWCMLNDDSCKAIAQRAYLLTSEVYKLDYVSNIFMQEMNEAKKRF